MEPLRIAHLVNPYLPVTQNWIHRLIAANTSCEHHIICRTRINTTQFPQKNLFCEHKQPSVAYHASMVLARLRARYNTKAALHYCTAIKPQVLHAHFAWEAWRYRDLIHRLGVPLVTTFYGLDVAMLPRQQVWRNRYTELFNSLGQAFCVEGPHMAECLQKLGCPKNKIHILRQGVDCSEFTKREPADPDLINILFVGLNREKKGALDAVQAFITVAQEIPSAHLHLIGDGPYRSIVIRMLNRSGLSRRATFHGLIPVDQYRAILSMADILLAPSVTARSGDTEGGAPVTIIEAMASGIPIVATTHCDIPDVVKHGTNGLLAPEHDITTLANHLHTLCSDASARAEFGRAGMRLAIERHSIQNIIDQLNSIYRLLV